MVKTNKRTASIIKLILISTLLTGCASMNVHNDPDTLIDDFLVIGTLGLYRGGM